MIEIFILLGLIILNGLFAMSEIALVSARKTRLEQLANQGVANAKITLKLIEKPEVFLSTIQVGITFISIVTGLYSGEKFSKDLQPFIEKIESLRPYAASISTTLIVILVTLLTLVGELIPKKIGLLNAEKIALVAGPVMSFLSRLAFPIIWFLNSITRLFFTVLKIKTTRG